MKTVKRKVTVLMCTAALAALSGAAAAKPAHHGARHYRSVVAQAAQPAPNSAPESDHGYSFLRADWAESHGQQKTAQRRVSRNGNDAYASADTAGSAFSGFGGDLVSEARRYIGTNPTNRSTLWCGAFVDVVLRNTGHKPGSALARAYLNYGPRVAGPQPGAIAVFNGGSHVGIVSGVDSNGNPIIISGNFNHTTAERAFDRSRIAAYVMPGG